MKRYCTFVGLYLLILATISCSKSTRRLFNKDGNVKGTDSPYVNRSFYKKESFALTFDKKHSQEIKARYLGCGGFYLERGSSALLIDPFFSNTNPLGLLTTGLKTKRRNVNHGLDGIKENIRAKNKAILVSHSHYDHLMDVPFVHLKRTDTTINRIYCSSSAKNILESVVYPQQVIDLQQKPLASWYQEGTSYPIDRDSTVVITPIATTHAPHYKSLRLYEGEAETKKKFKKPGQRSRPGKWRLGQTFAFLIDYLDENDEVAFRIYIQSSAAPPKHGWLNESLKKVPVDLAILGAASYKFTTDYPEALVNHLEPEMILICHWEDFFVRYKKKRKKVVRLTNLKEYIKRLNAVYPYQIGGRERFIMTDPGVNFTIKY